MRYYYIANTSNSAYFCEVGEKLKNSEHAEEPYPKQAVLRIRMFLGLQDPDPDPSVRGTDPDPSIIKQK
jgi:hypothetical protein